MDLIKTTAWLAAGILAMGWLTATLAEAKPVSCKGTYMYMDRTTHKCMDSRLKK